jgi:CheY-like chemotaxis protein
VNKVLLIDDDPVVTSVYQGLFAEAGYNAIVAEDGEAGLNAVHRHRPNAVLLDLMMPRLNGLQWLEKVRRDIRFENLPVVIFTSGAIPWQMNAARNSDVTMILNKRETDPQKVVQAVNNAIVVGGWTI